MVNISTGKAIKVITQSCKIDQICLGIAEESNVRIEHRVAPWYYVHQIKEIQVPRMTNFHLKPCHKLSLKSESVKRNNRTRACLGPLSSSCG